MGFDMDGNTDDDCKHWVSEGKLFVPKTHFGEVAKNRLFHFYRKFTKIRFWEGKWAGWKN
jgi:hypothetical protein